MGSYILWAALLALLVAVYLRFRREKVSKHDHDHGTDFDRAADEFSNIHAGKDNAGGCKFDPDEVRRTALLPKPPIDLDNIPAPDPRVQELLDEVCVDTLREALLKLSGEKDAIVSGKPTRIRTRNSKTGDDGINKALDWVLQFYRTQGILVRRVPYKVRGRNYFNIEATIPGKKDPKKVLVVGAHLDSTAGWPWGTEYNCPGADDDGSGTITVMSVAYALSKLPLDCTVRILHFTGEEQGLWGSYRYSDQLADEVRNSGIKVIGMLQHDMVAYDPDDNRRLDVHDEKDRNGSRELLVRYFRIVKQYGLNLAPFDTHNYAVRNRSDHAGFLDHGWRALMFSEEFTDEGFNPNYHKTSDKVQALNLPFMVEVVRGAIALSADLAGLQPAE